MHESSIPKELENKQIRDEHLIKSYDALSNQERVWIKTTLALNEACHTPCLGPTVSSLNHTGSGFQVKKHLESVKWTILLLDINYASASRLAAALMSARLADVQNVIAVWIGVNNSISSTNISCNILTTLELSGIEDIFILTLNEFEILTNHLQNTFGQGRILYFPDSVGYSKIILSETIPYWKDDIIPNLLVDPNSIIDRHILKWAHPNAVIKNTTKQLQLPDALYCSPQQEHLYQRSLIPRIFHPGLEAYWFNPYLSPSFFIKKTWTISLTLKD